MPKHTSSPQRMMLTTITELIAGAEKCKPPSLGCSRLTSPCPLMHKLEEAKHSLQTEVKNLGENDRNQRP